MKINFIGDMHGNLIEYSYLISQSKFPTIQVGDMGVGFCDYVKLQTFYENGKNRFIRGNHDNLSVCKRMPNFISDGTIEVLDNQTKIMYIGGAYSIDKDTRTEGLDYWSDEELSYREWSVIFDIYERNKPDILVTHDCPKFIQYPMFKKTPSMFYRNITSDALVELYDIHKPKKHIFGHWHKTKNIVYDQTDFWCIGEKEMITIDV